ncbi:DUF4147 domain-containing protein [Pseudoduganella sp. LjRoot289]
MTLGISDAPGDDPRDIASGPAMTNVKDFRALLVSFHGNGGG